MLTILAITPTLSKHSPSMDRVIPFAIISFNKGEWANFWCIHGSIFFSVVLTFCSLSKNEIKTDGVRELAGALQVNQSLQQLE